MSHLKYVCTSFTTTVVIIALKPSHGNVPDVQGTVRTSTHVARQNQSWLKNITSIFFNSILTTVGGNSSKPLRSHAPEVHGQPACRHTLLVRTVISYNTHLNVCNSITTRVGDHTQSNPCARSNAPEEHVMARSATHVVRRP